MKEVLFDFAEFKERVDRSKSKVHFSYVTRSQGPVLVSYTFRLSILENPTHILIFEKSADVEFYEKEKIDQFKEECRKLIGECSATPGYFTEEVKI